MTDTSADVKSVPLPYFNGEEGEFELFWPKFEAYANLKGFAEAILETRDPDLPGKQDVLDGATDDDKKAQ